MVPLKVGVDDMAPNRNGGPVVGWQVCVSRTGQERAENAAERWNGDTTPVKDERGLRSGNEPETSHARKTDEEEEEEE